MFCAELLPIIHFEPLFQIKIFVSISKRIITFIDIFDLKLVIIISFNWNLFIIPIKWKHKKTWFRLKLQQTLIRICGSRFGHYITLDSIRSRMRSLVNWYRICFQSTISSDLHNTRTTDCSQQKPNKIFAVFIISDEYECSKSIVIRSNFHAICRFKCSLGLSADPNAVNKS